MTLALWFLPPKIVSVTRREKLLLWLDALAKWSMVDIFSFIVILVSYRIRIDSPSISVLPDNFYSFDLVLIPKWGLYANMIAQLLSQISSHFIIYYHRKIVEVAEMKIDCSNGKVDNKNEEGREQQERKYQLSNYQYIQAHAHSSYRKLVVRPYVNYLLIFVACTVCLLILLGCIYPTFSVEAFGVLSLLIEAGQNLKAAVHEYSIFSILKALSDRAAFLNHPIQSFGLFIFSFLVLLCVLIVPILLTIALLCNWFIPMTQLTRLRMSVAIEILQAWQYCEVYIISVVVASWQLGPTSNLMVNTYCTNFNETLIMLGYYGVLSPQDTQCFQLVANIGASTYLIIIAAFLLALLNTFVGKASRQYFYNIEMLNKNSKYEQQEVSENDCAVVSLEEGAVDGVKAVSSSRRTDSGFDKSDSHDDNNNDNAEKNERNKNIIIPPVPVLFTDSFRWSLRYANVSDNKSNGEIVVNQTSSLDSDI